VIFGWTLATVVVVLAVTFVVARSLGRHNVMDVAWGLGFAPVAVVGYKVPRRPGEPRPGDGPWAVALHPASELLRRRVRVVGYAEYAARTSGFFPLPPRRSV
jgi:steroid 5-alpha reductase family enzyme